MAWWERLLKALGLKAEFTAAKVENLHLTKAATPAPTLDFDPSTGKVTLNLAGLSPEQLKATQEILRDAFNASKQTYLEVEASRKVQEVRSVEVDQHNNAILQCLKPIISSEDFLALRSALFLRSQYRAGRDVYELKRQMLERFGQRGGNIANLCSAGYFDSLPEQLSAARKHPDFDEKRFQDAFDTFVRESAFAIFIGSSETAARCREHIVERIRYNASYGLERILIHGIGRENIKKIRTAVNELVAAHPRITKSDETQVAESLQVRLSFPTDIEKDLPKKE